MGSDSNGIQQSPFDKSWPTPGTEGNGASGIGGGIDMPSGGNGIVSSPFDKAVVPVPGGEPTGDALNSGKSASTFGLDGSGNQGTNAPWDITSSRNTVDKR